MDAPTGSSDTVLPRAAALAADMARGAGQPTRISPPPVPGGMSPLDAALSGTLAAFNDTVMRADAADIAAADQQQAVLVDLARREQEDHL